MYPYLFIQLTPPFTLMVFQSGLKQVAMDVFTNICTIQSQYSAAHMERGGQQQSDKGRGNRDVQWTLPIIVAPFSNGGYFVYQHLRRLLIDSGKIQHVRSIDPNMCHSSLDA